MATRFTHGGSGGESRLLGCGPGSAAAAQRLVHLWGAALGRRPGNQGKDTGPAGDTSPC